MSKHKNVLEQNLEQLNKETMSYEDFMNDLDTHAPMKKK